MNRGSQIFPEAGSVCPTYVGMNRQDVINNLTQQSMPHVCGDEPQTKNGGYTDSPVCPT